MRYWWVAILLSGCGSGLHTITAQDSAFQPYLDNVVKEAQKRGRGLDGFTVTWGSFKEGDVEAMCYYNPVSGNTIVFDKTLWAGWTDDTKNAVLLHEVGHCGLGKGHDPNMVNGRPESIMYPSPDVSAYVADPNYYLDQLF